MQAAYIGQDPPGPLCLERLRRGHHAIPYILASLSHLASVAATSAVGALDKQLLHFEPALRSLDPVSFVEILIVCDSLLLLHLAS
jgi:hypothetical protein